MTDSVAARVTRSSGTSFYYAFCILPERKRRAIFALYSFCRLVDDCVDEEGGEGEAGLARWLEEVARCYAGRPETELGRELAEAVFEFPIPRSCFEDIVDGCRMDLTYTRYSTFEELRGYCHRVASAVGLASIEIFGYKSPETRDYAVALGLALQLSNILRDVSVDAARGRLYVPLDEIARFGLTEAEVRAAAALPGPAEGAALRALLDHQAERARGYYAKAAALLPRVDRRSMLPAEVMGSVYRALLEKVVRRGYPMAGSRTRLSKLRKLLAVVGTVPRVCWGLRSTRADPRP